MASSSIQSMEVEKQIAGPDWLELPRDVTANILQRLGTIDLLTSACKVCPLWWNICKDPHMWRTINITEVFSLVHHSEDELPKICRKAIKRSCGLLEDIDIERFATDDLLAYIAASSVNLRHMRLAMCGGLSDEGFSESVKKLPLLEFLDITYGIHLSKESIEVVGQYCPLLKTFKCSMTELVVNNVDTDVSFAIAKTMPGLHHLKISGDMPTNEGVLAILAGCPLLEYLDFENCLYSSFEYKESLEKKCREKIKEFRPPSQNVYSSDYLFRLGLLFRLGH